MIDCNFPYCNSLDLTWLDRRCRTQGARRQLNGAPRSRSSPTRRSELGVPQGTLDFRIHRRRLLRDQCGGCDRGNRLVHGGPQMSARCASLAVLEQRTHRRYSKVGRAIVGIIERQIRRLNRHAVLVGELIDRDELGGAATLIESATPHSSPSGASTGARASRPVWRLRGAGAAFRQYSPPPSSRERGRRRTGRHS
jgi:hypothetical protein